VIAFTYVRSFDVVRRAGKVARMRHRSGRGKLWL
jgi:hypothetical protein